MGVLKKETLRKRVKKSLIEQLEAKGADVEVFLDQINDYMTMWDLKESLKDDIKENGLRMYYRASNGGSTEKDNPSASFSP